MSQKPAEDKITQIGYPPRSAGRLMIKEFPIVNVKSTIGSVEKTLIQKINWYKTINYVYVVDDDEKLVGVLSVKELFRKSKETEVSKVMNRELVTAKPEDTKAKVTYIAIKNKLKSVPVIDKEESLIGIITSDQIYSTAYKEARADLMKFSGYGGASYDLDSILDTPLITGLKHRLPWLFVSLLGGIVVAKIIDYFGPALEKNLILASFIPLVANISGSTGLQSQVFIIRDLVMHPRLKISKYLVKQFATVLLIGLAISLVLFGVVFTVYGNPITSLAISVALFCAVGSSLVSGLFIPFLFNKLKIDPANASGPVGTIVQDLITVFIYFTVATILL